MQARFLAAALLAGCWLAEPAAVPSAGRTTFTFDRELPGGLPSGWNAGGTNQKSALASWSVAPDDTAPSKPQVLALSRIDHGSTDTLNLCWTDRLRVQDGRFELSFKAVGGTAERGGGATWRVQDKNNYYACRANPLQGKLRLECVVAGAVTQLATADVKLSSGTWHTLAVEHKGEKIVCWLNGEKLLEATDSRIAKAGGLGVCTKGDALTSFDDVSAAPFAQAGIQIPGGEAGIGFDDLRYSRRLGRVLVPAGRTGTLALVEPETGAVTTIAGFGAKEGFSGGHSDGTTSVDEGGGLLFAIDRTTMKLHVVDPAKGELLTSAPLAATPDYVRYVAATNELWVTEPDAEQIEVFRLSKATPPVPEQVAMIKVAGGPESLVIDGKRGRAYSHLWRGSTVSIDVAARTILATWKNGCAGSRGIALDEERGFLFVGCAEGLAIALDVAHDGKELSSAETGAGVDIIDYDVERGHLYVPGAKSATLTILGVNAKGELAPLGKAPVAKGAHCATSDGNGRVFVGDPATGSLIVVEDKFPSSRR